MASPKNQKQKVIKPFHLPLEDAKELFKDFKAFGSNIIIVGLNPITTSSLYESEDYQKKQINELSRKGFQVISIGSDVKAELKEGDIISISDQAGVVDAVHREIIVNDVFPRLRKYTILILAYHYITHYVLKDNTILDEISLVVDNDYILDKENLFKKQQEKQNEQ